MMPLCGLAAVLVVVAAVVVAGRREEEEEEEEEEQQREDVRRDRDRLKTCEKGDRGEGNGRLPWISMVRCSCGWSLSEDCINLTQTTSHLRYPITRRRLFTPPHLCSLETPN
ncbi:hypothetical protein E2C01_029008 [Portunus trituberculatus]|uniref:Secreted protein n=1 Tax=Portunus trituberculatus TaxID=210409 RepID=A0A5B7ERN7_PORTR|nr:hypothetical protein [Portunus trituberculatus]